MLKIYAYKTGRYIRTSPSLKDHIDSLKDGSYVISIDREKRIRSPNENRFYWGVFLPYLTDTGYTVEELHELFKKLYLSKKKRLTKLGRKTIETARSTTELSTIEFEEYMEKIREFAKGYGYILPYPNE